MTSSRKRHRRQPAAASTLSRTDTDPDPDSALLSPSTQDLDDGVFFRRRETRHHPRYKDSQLCAQVAEAVSTALIDVDDVDLACLLVVSVVPAPDASRLLVTVCSPAGSSPIPADELTARLTRLKGHLRAEVAWVITRKRAPDLAFVVGVAEEAWR